MKQDFPIINCNHLSLNYGSHKILDDVSFKLSANSFYFLTGASGTGKTSLLKMIYGALKPHSGDIHVLGHPLQNLNREELQLLRQKVGIVFQEDHVFDHLTIYENVALPLKIMGKNNTEVEDHVIKLLKWIGLERHVHELPTNLSGGEKGRLAIARAIITRPKVLLADEPTGNVDDAMALKLLHLFVELHKSDTTVLIATHNQALVHYFKYPRLHLENHKITLLPPAFDQGEAYVA
jgi:cell division transport system ATP-binding protein